MSEPAVGLGSAVLLELIVERFPCEEITRYEAAIRGNAAYLISLDAADGSHAGAG